jgi:hypothetical protein
MTEERGLFFKDLERTITVAEVDGNQVLMILPQVHLRKPCYDFSFL